MKKYALATLVFSALFFSGAILTSAQADLNESTNIEPPAGTVDCFEYYNFGSVQTDIMLRDSSIDTGTDVQFTGTITNSNKYPVVNGTFYVKIFKERGKEKDANGPDVIDQFIAKDNISIDANSSVRVSFPWRVPSVARAGNYRTASFFVTDKKFNLLGLSFTDDVVGNMFDFEINGKDSGAYFDKSSVIINERPYYFAAYPPRIDDKDAAAISAKIVNTTSEDQAINIVWKLYRWDTMNPENLIRTTPASITVKARSSSTISITVPDREFPVYLLVGELSYKDAKSILNIRFVRSGVDKVRLNFPSITQFPIVKGVASTMFSCLHNSGTSALVSGGKLVLELKDGSGKSVASYTYTGGITGDMMAVKKDFVSSKTLDNVTLRASLYQAEKLVDESNIVYDCRNINPTKCNSTVSGGEGARGGNSLLVKLGGVALLMAVLGAAYNLGMFKNKTGTIRPLVVLFVLALSVFVSPSAAEAKSASFVNTVSTNTMNLFYQWQRWGLTEPRWDLALKGRSVAVIYNAEIRMASTGELVSDGGFVPVGSDIILKFLPHQSTDISWFGLGYAMDSPYGEWRASAATPPTVSCDEKDFVGSYTGTSYLSGDPGTMPLDYSVYIPLVVAPPTQKTITATGPLSCGTLSGDETNGYSMSCNVTSAGSINIKFDFNATTGKFYYRYYDRRDSSPSDTYIPGCYGNDVNMKRNSGGLDYTLAVTRQTIEYNLTTGSSAPNIVGGQCATLALSWDKISTVKGTPISAEIGPIWLNNEEQLFHQEIKITNNTGAQIPGVRLVLKRVADTPSGKTILENPSGISGAGKQFLQHNYDIPAGASITLNAIFSTTTISTATSRRRTFTPAPVWDAASKSIKPVQKTGQAILASDKTEVTILTSWIPKNPGLINPILASYNLITFTAEDTKWYALEYSDNGGGTWTKAWGPNSSISLFFGPKEGLVKVFDFGPPFTKTEPTSSRIYRVWASSTTVPSYPGPTSEVVISPIVSGYYLCRMYDTIDLSDPTVCTGDNIFVAQPASGSTVSYSDSMLVPNGYYAYKVAPYTGSLQNRDLSSLGYALTSFAFAPLGCVEVGLMDPEGREARDLPGWTYWRRVWPSVRLSTSTDPDKVGANQCAFNFYDLDKDSYTIDAPLLSDYFGPPTVGACPHQVGSDCTVPAASFTIPTAPGTIPEVRGVSSNCGIYSGLAPTVGSPFHYAQVSSGSVKDVIKNAALSSGVFGTCWATTTLWILLDPQKVDPWPPYYYESSCTTNLVAYASTNEVENSTATIDTSLISSICGAGQWIWDSGYPTPVTSPSQGVSKITGKFHCTGNVQAVTKVVFKYPLPPSATINSVSGQCYDWRTGSNKVDVTVSWSPPPPPNRESVSKYGIDIYKDNTFVWGTGVVIPAITTSYVVPGLLANTTYKAVLYTLYNTYDGVSTSTSMTFTTPTCVGQGTQGCGFSPPNGDTYPYPAVGIPITFTVNIQNNPQVPPYRITWEDSDGLNYATTGVRVLSNSISRTYLTVGQKVVHVNIKDSNNLEADCYLGYPDLTTGPNVRVRQRFDQY